MCCDVDCWKGKSASLLPESLVSAVVSEKLTWIPHVTIIHNTFGFICQKDAQFELFQPIPTITYFSRPIPTPITDNNLSWTWQQHSWCFSSSSLCLLAAGKPTLKVYTTTHCVEMLHLWSLLQQFGFAHVTCFTLQTISHTLTRYWAGYVSCMNFPSLPLARRCCTSIAACSFSPPPPQHPPACSV